MIYYFSGTGNSTFVATTIANFLSMDKAFIPSTDVADLEMPEDKLIFVFPVYSWGIPPLISKFIYEIRPEYWQRLKDLGLTVECVMTCGDEVALAPEMITKVLKKAGVNLNSIWSVIMPNNYVLLPGFDVDSKDVEQAKLRACQKRIIEIAQGISRGDKRVDVVRGKMPWIKTKIVYPLFKKWGIFPKKWHYQSTCIGCGKCEKICPMLNVQMIDRHPKWGSVCCSCLGCYHVCPVHAVEYGNETKKKGQYLFPLRPL